MVLTPGTSLGPYEILSALGTGGMGEVYRGRDTRLDRIVAIKVMPADLAADHHFRARFDREARAISQFTHPHICTLYDVGEADGTAFLVMELLQGQTLAERLNHGPLPLEEAITIARDVADALSAAHKLGIIHRDLKPGNIMLTKSGPKLLDFGLAKTAAPVVSIGVTSTQEETAAHLTGATTILGTLHYMSPEQIRGEAADQRSDLFSLGVVLYEMLAGARPFVGDSAVETMHAILTDDPPQLPTVGRAFSPAIGRLLRHALEKNPDERFQSARDLAFALESLAGSEMSAVERSARLDDRMNARRRWRATFSGLSLVVLVGFSGLAALFIAGSRWRSDRGAPTNQWTAEDLGGSAFAGTPRLSPDGQLLAFVAMVDHQTQVALMKPGSGNWTILTSDRSRGSVGDLSWSPDGTKIFFDRLVESAEGVFSVPVLGGEESLVVEKAAAPHPLSDGSLLVTMLNAERIPQLYRVRADNSPPEPLNAFFSSPVPASRVRVFADGREAVFLGRTTSGSTQPEHLYAIDLASRTTRRLAPESSVRSEDDDYLGFPLAVTQDDQWVIFDNRLGDLHRIVKAPRDGSNQIQPLFTTLDSPHGLDSGADGSVYIDQVRDRVAVLQFSPLDKRMERTEVVNMYGAPLPLPDGRLLASIQNGGRKRLVTIVRGKEPTLFVPTTAEETNEPATLLARDQVAFLLGSPPNRKIAIASIADGRIVRRLGAIDGEGVTALAGSPDGHTLYYVVAGTVWSVPSGDGPATKVHAGDSVAVDPNGRYLIVKLVEKDISRLVQVSLRDGQEIEIAFPKDLRLSSDPLAPNAVGRDGRLALRVVSRASFFWPPAIFDPQTRRLEPITQEFDFDAFGSGWSDDGRIVSAALTLESRLWRFRPVK